jgi:hypothetical protein
LVDVTKLLAVQLIRSVNDPDPMSQEQPRVSFYFILFYFILCLYIWNSMKHQAVFNEQRAVCAAICNFTMGD